MVTALVKKDRKFLLAFFAAGALVYFLTLADVGFARLWVVPDQELKRRTFALWLMAVPFGTYAAVRERVFRTEEFLWHRPLSLGRSLVGRWAGCALVLVGWMTVPLLLNFLWSRFVRADASLIERGRFWQNLAVSFIALPTFAAAFFAATVSRRLLVAVLLGGPWPLIVFPLTTVLFVTARPRFVFGGTLAAALGLTALLLFASYQQLRRAHDPDLPVPFEGSALARGLSVIGLGFVVAAGISDLASELARELVKTYPVIFADGDRFGLGVLDRHARGWRYVDSRHRGLSSADGRPLMVPPHARVVYVPSFRRLSSDVVPRPQRATELLWSGPHEAAFFDRARGEFVVVRSADSEDGAFYRRAVRRPDGRPFSSETVLYHSRGAERIASEGVDRGLFHVDLGRADAPITPLALPGGDRLVRFEELGHDKRGRDVSGLSSDVAGLYALVAVGERGVYSWWSSKEGRGFLPLQGELAARWRVRTSHAPDVQRGDRLAFTTTLTSSDGRVAFAHDYAPRTALEQTGAAFVASLGFFRPTVVQALSALPTASVVRVPLFRELADPLLPGGRRYGLLGAQVALSFALAGFTKRRLARLGASSRRRLFWSVSVAFGGLAVYVPFRLWETARTYSALAAPGAAKSTPLITERAASPRSEEAAPATS